MSTDVRPQTGQGQAAGLEEASALAGERQNPQTLIQESIKYRRRAQEAERRAEALETEIQSLREGREDRAAALEADLAEARAEAEALRGRVETTDLDRRLERELARAGCADTETGLALAHERLAGAGEPEDLGAFARTLLDEKPHLRGGPPGAARGLPPRTAAAKPAATTSPRRLADRLAEQARQSGNAGDLMAYMRARRGAGA